MKRLTAFVLSAALLLTPVLAAGADEKFPAEKTYPGFADVKESDWFYDTVKLCYEIGLMQGTNKGFEPGKVLTVAECAAIAARMREALTGQVIPQPIPDPGLPWYQHYLEYMRDAAPTLAGTLAHPEEECSRRQFLSLLNAAVPEAAGVLTAINAITLLPDEDSEVVLKFYNAGILTGVDKLGTFAGDRFLTRSEAAATVSRIAREELRQTFVPGDPLLSPAYRMQLALEAAHLPSGAVVLVGVTSEDFLTAVNNSIARAEEAAMAEGVEFNWHNTLGGTDQTCLEWVKAQVLSDLGVTAQQGGELYQDFDYQVYYSRLIDLTGETLAPDYGIKPGGLS